MLSISIIVAIIAAIAIGYKTKINTGIIAIVFAYVIGSFVMGMSAKQVILAWPIKTMFIIFSVSLFYNFALVNGTLDKLARHLLYACRKHPALLPFALYLAATVIAGLGAGFFTVIAFMAPITLMICEESKMDKLIGAVAVNFGALSGGNFMTSGLGVVFISLMDEAGYSEQSFMFTAVIFAASIVFALIVISIFKYVPVKNRKIGEGIVYEKPEPLNRVQRVNFNLMLAMIVIVLFFPIAHIILPDSSWITYVNKRMDVGLVAIVFSFIALLLDLAPQNEVISKIPWKTIIMISGVGMLIAVAIEAGTINALSAWAGSNLPIWSIPIVFTLIGAFMSFFSSTTGVVCPALFPLVPELSATTGISPLLIFACIVLGAQATAISPFSSGGSLILGSVPTDEERDHMFSRLLFIAVPVCIGLIVIFNIVLSFIL
ncbi:SLC13 family permease [Fusibacter ferrireducens]|uniref:SLC13 family permease n=1 Tax=Fusibacter ferrireducens TaxID=2785058 RepID=A0ABR9ZXR5_9FIRM|nr:SLC13 family permease [Fusibacter ferrireducens]MBF4695259.1 SLC13 family permease [Fusibacter ferrireducens]